MKITGFNPLIVTKDAESAAALFEALGFEQRHHGRAVNTEGRTSRIRMKDRTLLCGCVADDTVPQDLTLIRINVDDFDESYAFLLSKGFSNPKGDRTVDTKSNRNAVLVAPSGFAIHLCHHIKDHD
jgi:hypothetical protein